MPVAFDTKLNISSEGNGGHGINDVDGLTI